MDRETENSLARKFKGFAVSLAGRFAKQWGKHWHDDFVSAALLGLLKGIRSFREEKGMEQRPYLGMRICNEIMDEVRRQTGRRPGSPKRSAKMLREADLCDDADDGIMANLAQWEPDAPDPAGDFEHAMSAACIAKEKRAMVADYFLRGMTMKKIARKFGLSESRISQALAEALRDAKEFTHAN